MKKQSNPSKRERKKPGPHEKLHTLYPLTFEQALGRALKYKSTKPKKKSKPNKSTE